MKKTAVRILLLLASLLLAAALTACGAPKPAAPAQPPAAPTEEPAAPTEEPAAPTEEPAAPEAENYLDVTGVDFSAPSISIAYDDYAGMDDLARKMQNFDIPAGTVVEIDGEVGMSMMSHTIVIPNAEGSQRVGTTYEVVGDDSLEFPPDGTRIHIVGVIRMNDNYFNVLVVPAEHFTVKEG